ncbi:unnamed protein product [Pocillopora meandrina]|uniref:DED domain-containing protein n=1 Tax=Pocillopora meandrina TaxID=46732 RepID=A0AAU9W2G0_9CNID|nr:unnamed protein product [Pocillopora meandrina]
MASAREESRISPYRKLLIDLSMELTKRDLERLIYAVGDILPRRLTENMESGLKLFEALEQDVHISPQNLNLLQDGFDTIGRADLAQRIQVFSSKPDSVEADGGQDDIVTDGIGDQGNADTTESDPTDTINPGAEKAHAVHLKSAQLPHQSVLPFDGNLGSTPTVTRPRGAGEATPTKHCLVASSDNLSMAINDGSYTSSPAPSPAAVGQQSRGPNQAASSGRVQHDPAHGTPSVRYVNFLLYGGYSVEIIGGKHFKTPDGEFVEMKSGTQYKIHVKNSHTYGCHVDISIDGYDVGGWALRRGEEMSIERSAYEAKKFTFYRVKTAPKEAGIVSGQPENGVLKCVFTPEVVIAFTQGLSFHPPDETENAMERTCMGEDSEAQKDKLRQVAATVEWAQSSRVNVVERDPAWRAGATTLQGHSTQRFISAEPMEVDPSRKVELVLRLVVREGEEILEFPKDLCKPLSTLTPPAVQE